MKKLAFSFALLLFSAPFLFAQAEIENVPTPVELAQAQLEAYNQRDIEAFLRPYSDSVRIYGSLQELTSEGIEAMRATYSEWFNSLESLHCDVVNRIASGNTVVDHEKCVFKRPGKDALEMEAIAIYKVWDGKIQEVYFVKTNH